MGIPSFYRQLCRKFKHILSNRVPEHVQWLCLDFNCGMYGCLHSMRPYDGTISWESDFCYAIASYMEEIVALVKPTVGVFVACDGVVCAAKRRQQRLRRFKGPWISASEAYFKGSGLGTESTDPKWDQNALTPGSEFMAKLNGVLAETGKKLAIKLGLTILVSGTNEPGEGEHKLLSHMRSVRPESCVIYGLDADLLLLSLMLMDETNAEVHLLREAQEFEKITISSDEVQWKTLSIRAMATAMNLGSSIPVADFVASMSLLGNDFLPRSLTRTIRQDGIPQLLESLTRLKKMKKKIVVDGIIQKDSLLILLREWAATEETDMLNAARNALREKFYTVRCDPNEVALKEWQMLPGRWANLAKLLTSDKRDANLRSDWRTMYRSWHAGSSSEYCQGFAWVWDYYSGRPVDQSWMFDNHLPPLWCDIVEFLEKTQELTIAPPPIQYPEPLPEWLHLLAVLPADSVARLLPSHVLRLIAKEPLYWPTQWSIFDIGRSQLWECEPLIPILPEALLRSFIVSI